MSWSAHSDPESVKEHFCDVKTLEEQAALLAKWISSSRHFVAFSGAGISTSAGIPDFRGPEGVWTLRAVGKSPKAKTNTIKACPTPAHMALVSLQQQGHLKFMISQNTDGIHRRSGLDPTKLAELHGNTNLEICKVCGKDYLRDFRTRRGGNTVHEHETGRNCSCGGALCDSIINFGENLPKKALHDGFDNSKRADLMLVLGSSLTVSPANDMPDETHRKGGKLVICNLQKTPLDGHCDLRIFAKTDDLMKSVMANLGFEIVEWKLRRQLRVSLRKKSSGGKYQLNVDGVEPDGTPATFLSAVQIISKHSRSSKDSEPFHFDVDANEAEMGEFTVELYFMGHYNEPMLPLKVQFDMKNEKENKHGFYLEFNPKTGVWNYDRLAD